MTTLGEHETDRTDIDEMVTEYLRMKGTYEVFANAIEAVLKALFPKALTSHRAKEPASLRDKLMSPTKRYAALGEVPDLAGVRLIFTTIDSATSAVTACRNAFVVDEAQSRIMHATADSFGYESTHLVVQITDQRASLPDWAAYAGLCVEIQIRTVVQHAWAEISHSLQYKNPSSVPLSLRRQLNRVAALLEVADGEFSAVTRAHSQLLHGAVDEDATEVVPGAGIDVVSLRQLLLSRPKVLAEVRNDTLTAGFTIDHEHVDELDSESIAQLVALCTLVGVWEVREILEIAAIPSKRRQEYFRDIVRTSATGTWYGSPAFSLMLLVILANTTVIRERHLVDIGFDADIANRILEVATRLAAKWNYAAER